jgi:catechol 2,3-dioxygenase-like lactoylglutathione lyase family enzyme
MTPEQRHRGPNLVLTIQHMTIQRMDHVGIEVDDLAAATEFFAELGLVLQGEGSVEGRWVDRVVGLEGVRAEIAMMQTPDGNGRLELAKFHSPSNQATTGTRRPTPRVSATSHSPSRTSTRSSPAWEPAALNSSASWSATRTSTGSATSAARRESSSS